LTKVNFPDLIPGKVAYTFTDLLGAMDMELDVEVCPKLVQADKKTLAAKRQADTPLDEILALERAYHFNADYVYFRRLPGRPARATVYIYDWTERLGESQRSRRRARQALPKDLTKNLAHLHRDLWSAGEVPLVYVFLPTEIHIYHVLQGPCESKHGIKPNPWKTIELAAEVDEELKAFSASKLDDGRFWEENRESRALKLEGAAFMALSQEIGRCRAKLVHKHKIEDDLVKRLLILFVMIKYLEERKDQQGQGVFPPGTFPEFAAGAQGFVDLLRAGGSAVLAFLDKLAAKDRLNGRVFDLEPQERTALRTADLHPFADLLDARLEGEQRTFWRRYSFHELPVELISHLYEQFLPRKRGVVYTPPFLVSFILDEVLPLSQRTPESFRLIDPACGSGVFLVGAFKRLVHRWRRDNGFQTPDADTMRRLLRQHIFGMDLESEAIRLTLFSLSVALCDFLEPRTIWNDLHFDDLQAENLLTADFFAQVRREKWDGAAGFDLIVGNPPFDSKLTPAAASEVADLKKSDPEINLPDCQAALLFLQTATRIAKPNAQIALIQPSGPLLYNESSSRFRRRFLETVNVSQIVDLTHLSRILFKRERIRGFADESRSSNNPGDVAVAIVFAENHRPDDAPLLHVTVRRTVQAEQKLMFEVDHYDLHFVSRHEAISDPYIWKANFIGGGRISHLISRLHREPSLGAFLEKAASERQWVKGEGYIAGSREKVARVEALEAKEALSAEESEELKKLKKRYRKAPWLTGKTMLPTEAFTADGIDWSKLNTIEERFFAEPRSESLFSGPLLLIKEVIEAESEEIPVSLLNEGVRFKHRILGIHAPSEDLAELQRVHGMISDHRLVRFLLLATSSEYLINKSSAIRAADLLRLPFPDSQEDLTLSLIEEALIDDALDHVADFKRKGDKAAVRRPPNDEELALFGDYFCQVLGSVYTNLRAAPPVRMEGGICYPFYFGDAPSEPIDAGQAGALKVANLLKVNVSPGLRGQRILRFFHGNMLLLLKPAQLRYWLRSIAVRDADDIFVELQQQGY
jgi:hypothetical protein